MEIIEIYTNQVAKRCIWSTTQMLSFIYLFTSCVSIDSGVYSQLSGKQPSNYFHLKKHNILQECYVKNFTSDASIQKILSGVESALIFEYSCKFLNQWVYSSLCILHFSYLLHSRICTCYSLHISLMLHFFSLWFTVSFFSFTKNINTGYITVSQPYS